MVTGNEFERPNPRRAGPPKPSYGQAGFTIVEVVVAIIILAVGLLGLAGTTVLIIRQTTLADIASDRSVALQSTIERIRATPFDSVEAGSESSGSYDVAWAVTDVGQWKNVDIVTTGPGLSTSEGFPAIDQSVVDTFSFRIISP
jgi:prepilin-type N-terminal cleavage/methylation domain-containing protein